MITNSDLLNGEITLGSKLSDILAVLQGEWLDVDKNGWNLIKLSSKFCVARKSVKQNEFTLLPLIPEKESTAILYIGKNELKSDILTHGQKAITAPISGIAVIFY